MTGKRKGPAYKGFRHVEGILKIVGAKLCHRCGACVGFCPSGTLALDPAGYPVQVGECTACNKCVKVCSGYEVDYPTLGKGVYGERYRYGSHLGPLRAAYVGHAREEEIRRRGASGGVVTQLLVDLLERGRIRGALVVVSNPDNPAMAKGVIARSREEIVTAAQSKYTTSPSLAALRDLAGEQGPFAVVCLPCQAHAIRKAQMSNLKLARKLSPLIGLYCHYKLNYTASQLLVDLFSRGRTVREVFYRQKDEGGWPHNTIDIEFTDGSRWRSPLGPAETINILYRFTPLWRCLTCLDFAVEFADLAVGDPWIRDEEGHWKYRDPGGESTVIVHTEKGEEVMNSALRGGALRLREIPASEIARGQHGTIHEKKYRTPFRRRMLRFFGHAVPSYPMPLPPPGARVIGQEAVFGLLHQLTGVGPLQKLILRFAFSPLGSALMRARTEQKRRKARRRGRKNSSL